MPQSSFYSKVRQGLPAVIAQWLALGQGDHDRLALILAETARVAKLGEPEATPGGATLEAWSAGEHHAEIPLWAARTAVFLLIQMPARPVPQSDEEACAWAYCWLRNRRVEHYEAAVEALPAHLRSPLEAALKAAWVDQQGLRLV
ncbi:hypothetical protein OM427_28950 [Halomonas sp. 18H]|uniref:hypothetical protein n=1 Tax=Halomonas almeriensis TaxID=308163 RepID=UPI002230C10F|nr:MULTISPECIES: hypothetical protein [Halomonas]MCW4153543.1 hypothetical protein [Halomonas sp. 18H]MDN3551919.1 hypothetical protein [Halomonas almeriensis]